MTMTNAVILYIEDNIATLEMMRRILRMEKYKMLEAHTAKEGLELIERERPDLILMDINLPGDMSGLDAVGYLKQHPQFAAIPIVAVTANAMYGDRERYLSAGCDGYLAKPISKVELLNTLSTLLQH